MHDFAVRAAKATPSVPHGTVKSALPKLNAKARIPSGFRAAGARFGRRLDRIADTLFAALRPVRRAARETQPVQSGRTML